MSEEKHSTRNETGIEEETPEEETIPESGEPAPTDYRRHFWLLVAILMTVVIAAIVARVWMAAGGAAGSPDPSPHQGAPQGRQPR